jgi:hypothetical protein
MNSLAGASKRFYPSKGNLDLAFEKDEGLLKAVSVRRWTAGRWDMHVDKAEASRGVFPSEKDCVSVPHPPDVR